MHSFELHRQQTQPITHLLKKIGEYIVTHGAYTILGSCENPAEAGFCLSNLAPDFMDSQVRPEIEEQMERFCLVSLDGSITRAGKALYCPRVTDTEFRSSAVFEADGVVYIPGKISIVVHAAEEVAFLTDGTDAKVIRRKGY
jgi:hypothetical protein